MPDAGRVRGNKTNGTQRIIATCELNRFSDNGCKRTELGNHRRATAAADTERAADIAGFRMMIVRNTYVRLYFLYERP